MNGKLGTISIQNTDLIQRAIKYYPWERSLAEKDVNEKVYIFGKTIKNIFSTLFDA